MAAPLAADIAVPGQINLAPSKPLEKLQEKNGHKSHQIDADITKQVREKYQDRMKRDEPTWKEMILAGQLVGLFIEGKQLLDINPYTNQYTVRKQSRNDPTKIKAMNLMQYYASNWQSKWGSSNPDYILDALSNSDQDIAKARKANIVVDHLQEEMFDWWYVQQEGLLAQCFGWFGARVRLCNKKGKKIQRPVFEDREVQIGQGFGKCYDCEWSGPEVNTMETGPASFPTCPQCGSAAVMFEPPATQILQFETGKEDIVIPKVIVEQLPLPAVRFDQRFRMEDSPWRIYEYDVSDGAVQLLLGKDTRIPEGESPNKLGLEVANALAQVGSPMGGRSAETTNEKRRDKGGTIVEISLSAEDMVDLCFRGADCETLSGQRIPEGSYGSDLFPNGATFFGLNGFSLLWGIEPIHHSTTDSSSVYHSKVLSGTGRGVQDAAESQKRFNRFDSQAVRSAAAAATPATLHLEGAIPPNKRHLLGQPDVDIPISIQNFPEVRDIRQIIMPMPSGEIRGDLLNYTYQHLQNFMQLQYHITNFSGGLGQRVNNKTATGAEILDENADAMFTPVLTGKADMYRKVLQDAFTKWREIHRGVKTFVGLKSTAKSGARGIEISGEDVEGEYRWKVVPGSEIPRNKLTKRRDRMNFYGLFGGAPAYFQMKKDPNFRSEIAELEREFDMDFAANDYDDIGEMCRARFEMAKDLLDQTRQLAETAAQQYGVQIPPADPLLILPEVEPSMLVTESDHAIKGEWFSRLLDTPEGMRMSREERDLVSAFVTGHMALQAGQTLEMAIMQSQIQAAAAGPQQQMDLQNQAASAEIDAASQPPPPDVEGEAAMAEQSAQADHARKMELQTEKSKADLAREKIRAKAAEQRAIKKT